MEISSAISSNLDNCNNSSENCVSFLQRVRNWERNNTGVDYLGLQLNARVWGTEKVFRYVDLTIYVICAKKYVLFFVCTNCRVLTLRHTYLQILTIVLCVLTACMPWGNRHIWYLLSKSLKFLVYWHHFLNQ